MNKRLSLCAFALLAGCAVGPDYHRPSLDVPAQYHDVAPTTSDVAGDAASTGDSGWWEVYADADLQALLATALKNNYDVKIAVARIDAAWPAWLGLEAWLLPWVAPHVVAHARRVVGHLGDAIDGVIVFANPDAQVVGGYLEGSAPPWRRGAVEDAASARRQIDAIVATLREDPVVGAKMLGATRTITLDRSPEEILAERARAGDCEEIYVRSLVKGAGPTSAPAGLLVARAGQWSVCASPDLLSALG